MPTALDIWNQRILKGPGHHAARKPGWTPSPASRLIETPRKRTASTDRGDEHDNRDDGGREWGGPWPGRSDVPATQARGGVAPASGRRSGAGVALAGCDGGDALGLARGVSCRRRSEPGDPAH